MSPLAHMCVESHLRDLFEQGFEVVVARGASAVPRHPEWGYGYTAAHIMSGRELAGRLGPRRPRMKVLYMSGYASDASVHHGVLDERQAFLPKPVTASVLLSKVRETLDA